MDRITKKTNDVTHLFFTKWAEKNIELPRYYHESNAGLLWQNYPYFEKIDNTINDNQFTIINSFRHSGMSSFMVAHALWQCIFKTDQNILFATKSDRYAIEANKLMQTMIDRLPPQLGEKVKPSRCNSHEIHFADLNNEIRFFFFQAMKAKALTHLYIEDAAFIPNMDTHWQAMYPTLSTDGKCTAFSCPNGARGWFYDTFRNASAGKSEFKVVNLNQRDHPRWNVDFEKQLIENLGVKGFMQEFCGVFLPATEDVASLHKALNDERELTSKLRFEMKQMELTAMNGYAEAYSIISALRNQLENQKEQYEKEITELTSDPKLAEHISSFIEEKEKNNA